MKFHEQPLADENRRRLAWTGGAVTHHTIGDSILAKGVLYEHGLFAQSALRGIKALDHWNVNQPTALTSFTSTTS